MNRISLFRFTFEGASPCPSTPLISSPDGHIAVVFRESVYIFNCEIDHPQLIVKIKIQDYSDSLRIRHHANNLNSFKPLDHSKPCVTCASFTPSINYNLSDEANLVVTSYMVTCMDNGLLHYWLISGKPLKPVLTISLSHIFGQRSFSPSFRYYFGLSENHVGGFLQVVVSKHVLMFIWITCISKSNINVYKERENDTKHTEELKSTETGRSRRLAATRAIQFYTSLTISEDEESDNYVKSAESSDSEMALITTGNEEISMLPGQNYRFIGKYSKCNSNKENSNILAKFDYRKPLAQNLRVPVDSLQYSILHTHSLEDGLDITALKVGNINYNNEKFFDEKAASIEKATNVEATNEKNNSSTSKSCYIALANVKGVISLLEYTFAGGFNELVVLYVYEQDLLFVSPSLLLLGEMEGRKTPLMVFASSNQLFIGYKTISFHVTVEYQIIYFKVFSLIDFGNRIVCKVLIVGNGDQISRYKVTVSEGSICMAEDIPSIGPIKAANETVCLATDNPFKVIGLVSIPSTYYTAELYHSCGLFELTLAMSSDLSDLNVELMEIISKIINSTNVATFAIYKFTKRFHPLSLGEIPRKTESLSGIFTYFAELLCTSAEADYYKRLILSSIGNCGKNHVFILHMAQLLSNIVYSIVVEDGMRSDLLSRIDYHRRLAMINLIEYGVFTVESDGVKFPMEVILENLKLVNSDGVLRISCFCGEDAECTYPFDNYICKKSHKIPSCSLTRCALLGSSVGIIVPKGGLKSDIFKIMYKTLDYCVNCNRFALRSPTVVKGCLICGGKIVIKTTNL